MKIKQLTTALDAKTKKIIRIEDVKQGEPCDAICPACGAKLIAKKGDKVMHHFAHVAGADCENGYETSLIYQLKSLIEEYGIKVDAKYFDKLNDRNRLKVRNEQVVFPKVMNVESLYKDVPFLRCSFDGGVRDLLIAVEVNSIYGQKDFFNIKGHEVLSMLVIDIHKYIEPVSNMTLKRILQDPSSENRRWIFDRDYEDRQNKIEKMCDVIQSQTTKCPLRQFDSVQTSTICKRCPYNFKQKKYKNLNCILCLGRIRINDYNILKDIRNVKFGIGDNSNIVHSIEIKTKNGYKTSILHPLSKDSTLASLNGLMSIEKMWSVARYHFLAMDTKNWYYDVNVRVENGQKIFMIMRANNALMKNAVKINDTSVVVSFVDWLD